MPDWLVQGGGGPGVPNGRPGGLARASMDARNFREFDFSGFTADGRVAAPAPRRQLSQLCVLRLGCFQDGDVRVGVFPEGEEILIGGFGFGGVALQHVGAGQS